MAYPKITVNTTQAIHVTPSDSIPIPNPNFLACIGVGNQVDNGITVYRNMANRTTTAYIQKVKFRHIGSLGSADFRYNLQNGRYTAENESEDNMIYMKEQDFII